LRSDGISRPLYSGFGDPTLGEDRSAARACADAFTERYRGRVASLGAAELLTALREYERLTRLARRPGLYTSLRFAAATEDDDARAEHTAAQAFVAELGAQVVFFGLELKELPEDHLDVLGADDELRGYGHYLAFQRAFRPYSLDEQAEATITRKNVTGKNAWVQLYSQITAGLRFRVDHGGEVRELTAGEMRPLFESPDRSLRLAASKARTEGFAPHHDVLTFIFNTLLEDHRSEMQTRGYADVTDFTVLHDDLSPAVMTALMDAVSARADLSHRYQALRKRVLDLDDYAAYDRSAPLFGAEPEIPWDEAKAMVLDAFDEFSPRVGAVARAFFDDDRIDVFPRPGKQPGAFCAPGVPPDLPYILLNFTGTPSDVVTLAHELGHGMHGVLSLGQSALNYSTGLPLAETASVFAELLLHRRLLQRAGSDRDARRRLLDRQVSAAMGTAWTQVAFVRWEQRAHARRAEGVATTDEFSDLWMSEMRALWGDAMQLSESVRSYWMQIPHFVFARFYCYSYAFGKLLTLSLYGVWQERGDAFVDQYVALLEAGGSRSPAELVAELGLDLSDPGFWLRGIAVVEGLLTELEALVDA
jgi:oligoendopeptidase F